MAAETTYLEFSDHKSHKFYEVTVDGSEVTVRYGRIGQAGTTSVKTYDTVEKAQTEATKVLNAKLKKGYVPAAIGDNDNGIPSTRTKLPVPRGIARFNHLRRTAWTPILEPGEDDLLASKYLGKPWCNLNDPWVESGLINSYMLQINLQDLPAELQGRFGTGILQIFRPRMFPEDCPPIRLIQPEGEPAKLQTPPSKEFASAAEFTQFFESWGKRFNFLYENCPAENCDYAYRIVGWQPFDDYPTYREAEAVYNTEYGEDGEDEIFSGDDSLPRTQDKLSGWPCFWQNYDDGYPSCPICQQPMQFVFLLSTPLPILSRCYEDDECPVSLFQCREHTDQFGEHMDAF